MLPTRMFNSPYSCRSSSRSAGCWYAVRMRILPLTLLLTIVTGLTSALKDVTVVVPQAANIGGTVTLQCRYDLENEPLYTLKWYKGAREFYRYIPKELPNTQIFPYQNIDVDLAKSTQNAIVLRNLQPEHSGRYKCEVSTDAPNFYTHIQTGYMYVLNVPEGKPEMNIENTYENGDTLRGNCTSLPSYPAINLTWYINGKKINSSYTSQLPAPNATFGDTRKKPVITVIGLDYDIESAAFVGGKANIRCAAELYSLYKAQEEMFIEQERPKPRPSSVLQNNNDSSAEITTRPASITVMTGILLAVVIMR